MQAFEHDPDAAECRCRYCYYHRLKAASEKYRNRRRSRARSHTAPVTQTKERPYANRVLAQAVNAVAAGQLMQWVTGARIY